MREHSICDRVVWDELPGSIGAYMHMALSSEKFAYAYRSQISGRDARVRPVEVAGKCQNCYENVKFT